LEQLVFELAPPEPPRWSNFLAGRNRELATALRRFAEGLDAAPSFFLWGAPASGKSHLLQAAVAHAAECGIAARYRPAPPAAAAQAADEDGVALLAIDLIDEASSSAAARIFTLYNALKQRGARLLAASRTPLAAL